MMMGMEAAPTSAAKAANGLAKRKANGTGTDWGTTLLANAGVPIANCKLQIANCRIACLHDSMRFPRQPVRQVTRQNHSQVCIGPQRHVIDVLVSTAALQLGEKRVQ